MGLRRAATALATVAVVACGPAGPPTDASRADAWRGAMTTEGNITTVVNESGQVWQSVQLIEEASIGSLDGEDAYVFSQVVSLAADDERIYVLDRMANVARVYDRQGTHLYDAGGPGDGPGEFRRPWILGLTNAPRLLVRDLNQRRMHEFAVVSGELLGDWPAPGGGPTVITPEGFAYIWNRLPGGRNEDGTFNLAMIATGPEGQGDAIDVPPNDPEPPFVMVDRRFIEVGAFEAQTRGLPFIVHLIPFVPQTVWAVSPEGVLASGDGASYAFGTRSLAGDEVRISRQIDPVPLEPDEAQWYKNRLISFWRELVPDFVWEVGELPPVKRSYVSLLPDYSGRVWVLRELAGEALADCDPQPADFEGFMQRPCWRQPFAFDAFDAGGRFLGALPIPAGMRVDIPPYIRGDVLLAVVEDDAGAIMVKRYRLAVTE